VVHWIYFAEALWHYTTNEFSEVKDVFAQHQTIRLAGLATDAQHRQQKTGRSFKVLNYRSP